MTKAQDNSNNDVIITQARIQAETIKKLATLRAAKKKLKEDIEKCEAELFTNALRDYKYLLKDVESAHRVIMDDIAIVINDDIVVDGPSCSDCEDERRENPQYPNKRCGECAHLEASEHGCLTEEHYFSCPRCNGTAPDRDPRNTCDGIDLPTWAYDSNCCEEVGKHSVKLRGGLGYHKLCTSCFAKYRLNCCYNPNI